MVSIEIRYHPERVKYELIELKIIFFYFYFLNMNFSFTTKSPYSKFKQREDDIHIEGNISHNFDLGLC